MHFTIELSEIFNLSIKLKIRFLTKISKLSTLVRAYMVLTLHQKGNKKCDDKRC